MLESRLRLRIARNSSVRFGCSFRALARSLAVARFPHTNSQLTRSHFDSDFIGLALLASSMLFARTTSSTSISPPAMMMQQHQQQQQQQDPQQLGQQFHQQPAFQLQQSFCTFLG